MALKIGDDAHGGIVFNIDNSGQDVYVVAKKDIGKFNWKSARKECAKYKSGGFADWVLPSKSELELIQTNLHRAGLGNFEALAGNNRDGDWYWSSTESANDNDQAYSHYFASGRQDPGPKSHVGNVRAIRVESTPIIA